MEKREIIIIGGGVMGSATAYHLRHLGFEGSISVIEKDPLHRLGSTGLSAGGIRQQFGSSVNIQLSKYSIEFYENFSKLLNIKDHKIDIEFHQRGYLFLGDTKSWPILERRAKLQKKHGVEVEILTPEDIKKLIPDIDTEGIIAGTYTPRDGYLDPYAVMQGFELKAKELGVEYLTDEVTGINTHNGKITGVHTKEGKSYQTNTVVNAAGPWAGDLATLAGVNLPVKPLRRNIFVCQISHQLPYQLPMTIDASGTYFRHETGGRIMTGKSNPNEPFGYNFKLDKDWFLQEVWPDLATRMPLMEQIKLESGWAGLYEENTFDHNAIIGEHPHLKGFYLINGFSGHGMMQGPGASLALAELITTGKYQTIDATPLTYERFLRNEPHTEDAII